MEEFIGKTVKVVVPFTSSHHEGGSTPGAHYGVVEKVKDGYVFLVTHRKKFLKKEDIIERKAIKIEHISVIKEV